ncbi:MAG: AEC family transporter [Defluviitaleaceae bacterium]|nr:AEC family transporter [Defluviitaleaceae bacterium]
MDLFLSIALYSIVPIFILVMLGYALDKKFSFDIFTLTKINFYVFVPAFSFVNIYSTEITSELARVILLIIVMLLANYALAAFFVRILKLPGKTGRAFENSMMFYNSGNIGVSLITLIFSNAPFIENGTAPYLQTAVSIQIMILLVQNVTTNTVGFINSGGEGMTLKSGLIRVLKMPPLYAGVFGVLFKFFPFDIAVTPVWPALDFIRNGMVSFALFTLGVQMAKSKIKLTAVMPYVASFFRLIGGPALAFALIKLFGFTGVFAQTIFIASSTPAAVNTALLSVECKGDVDFAAQTVAVSTLFSAVTMTGAVYLSYILF